MRPDRSTRGRQGPTWLVMLVIGLFVILAVTMTLGATTAAGPFSGAGHTGNRVSPGPAASASDVMPAPCDLFADSYGPVSENGTVLPSRMPYYANYTAIFAQICVTPPFVSFYAQVDSPGDFGVGTYGRIGAVPTLFFLLTRVGTCTNSTFGPNGTECEFEATWSGYLANNSFSGPAVMQYLDIYSAGGAGISVAPSDALAPALWVGAAVAAAAAVAGLAVVRKRRKPTAATVGGTRPSRPSDGSLRNVEPTDASPGFGPGQNL